MSIVRSIERALGLKPAKKKKRKARAERRRKKLPPRKRDGEFRKRR